MQYQKIFRSLRSRNSIFSYHSYAVEDVGYCDGDAELRENTSSRRFFRSYACNLEIAIANSKLHGTYDYQVGMQVKLTAQPVKFKKNNVKKNLVTQMTQPVRRRYDVLLERYDKGWSARVTTN